MDETRRCLLELELLKEAIARSRAYACLECGKCTGVCPVSRVDNTFSPRAILVHALRGENPVFGHERALWNCLTCGLCSLRCPEDIAYAGLTRELRAAAKGEGYEGLCSHGGAFQSMMRIMTAPTLKQQRLDWVSSDLKTQKGGEWLYFVGCAPYFDIYFTDLGSHPLDIARATIRILNRMGIEPVLLEDERCCGHDLWWSGDVENFRLLAQHNMEQIRASGAKKVVFSCPEGLSVFKEGYPEVEPELGFEVYHITELLSQWISSGEIEFHKDLGLTVTYQDPCRLGRHLGIYDEPRTVLDALPGVELVEMPKSRERAICCGTSTWMNCTAYSKMIQIARLKEAKATGADRLVTACPKCEIHFRCAIGTRSSEEIQIEPVDVVTLAAEALD